MLTGCVIRWNQLKDKTASDELYIGYANGDICGIDNVRSASKPDALFLHRSASSNGNLVYLNATTDSSGHSRVRGSQVMDTGKWSSMAKQWWYDGLECPVDPDHSMQGKVCASKMFMSGGSYTGLSMNFIMPILDAAGNKIAVLATEQMYGPSTTLSRKIIKRLTERNSLDSEIAIVQKEGEIVFASNGESYRRGSDGLIVRLNITDSGMLSTKVRVMVSVPLMYLSFPA